MRVFLLAAAALALPAAQPPSNPRELVRQSIANGERAWRNSFDYFCVKRDRTQHLDGNNHVASVEDYVFDAIPLGGHTSYEELVRSNGEPVPAAQKLKFEGELRKLRAEPPSQKEERFRKLESDRSYMAEVADAFDFVITGETQFPTGPAWVLRATPHPGYQPKSRYAHMFPNMRGTLWIDEKDVQWVKADAEAVNAISFGFFIARLSKGSHIVVEQMKLPDGAWVPKAIDARASARTFIFFNHNFEEEITYSDYRKATGPAETK